MNSLLIWLHANLFAAGCAPGSVDSSTFQQSGGCMNTNLPQVKSNSDQLQTILGIAFGSLAALSVLFIVIGGFRYVISGGDPESMSKAKSTIIYAIIGLLVALFAEAIVGFGLSFIQ